MVEPLECTSRALIDYQEGISKAPLFHGSNYVIWNTILNIYLMALGYNIYDWIMLGFSTDGTIKESRGNTKKRNGCHLERPPILCDCLGK